MTKKTGENGVSCACKLGEIADVYCAPEREGFSGAELLTRAVANSDVEKGLPGRCSL